MTALTGVARCAARFSCTLVEGSMCDAGHLRDLLTFLAAAGQSAFANIRQAKPPALQPFNLAMHTLDMPLAGSTAGTDAKHPHGMYLQALLRGELQQDTFALALDFPGTLKAGQDGTSKVEQDGRETQHSDKPGVLADWQRRVLQWEGLLPDLLQDECSSLLPLPAVPDVGSFAHSITAASVTNDWQRSSAAKQQWHACVPVGCACPAYMFALLAAIPCSCFLFDLLFNDASHSLAAVGTRAKFSYLLRSKLAWLKQCVTCSAVCRTLSLNVAWPCLQPPDHAARDNAIGVSSHACTLQQFDAPLRAPTLTMRAALLATFDTSATGHSVVRQARLSEDALLAGWQARVRRLVGNAEPSDTSRPRCKQHTQPSGQQHDCRSQYLRDCTATGKATESDGVPQQAQPATDLEARNAELQQGADCAEALEHYRQPACGKALTNAPQAVQHSRKAPSLAAKKAREQQANQISAKTSVGQGNQQVHATHSHGCAPGPLTATQCRNTVANLHSSVKRPHAADSHSHEPTACRPLPRSALQDMLRTAGQEVENFGSPSWTVWPKWWTPEHAQLFDVLSADAQSCSSGMFLAAFVLSSARDTKRPSAHFLCCLIQSPLSGCAP